MYRVAICDDSRKDTDLLLESIKHYEEERQIDLRIQVFTSGEELLEQMEHTPDFSLIFLDVRMPGCDGIMAGKEIRNTGNMVPIIYLSVSRDFAVESYEVKASGYLLKPFEEARIFACLDRYLPKEKEQLVVKINGSYRYFPYQEIRYLESRGHSVIIHLRDQTALWGGKLSELEKMLADPRFLRCHQSYLVNMDEIFRVEEQFVLDDGERVPIRVREKHKITEQYYQYFVKQSLR